MPARVGTSGWMYRDWRERFYPKEVPQRGWLEYYASRFDTVESNNAFYRLPAPEMFEAWARRTPHEFVFAVKVSRYLTHIKRLKEPAEPVQRFLKHARGLGAKLGPALLQLPPNLKADLGALDETLAEFDPDVRVAVEFRHPTWFSDECRALLAERGTALCWTSGVLRPGGPQSRPTSPEWRTASWGYVRFHQGASKPFPCYGRDALARWAGRIADGFDPADDVYVYFNNDYAGCAVRDAGALARRLRRAGWEVTSTPGPREVAVG
jgi:uncharacterized protein YecE (DUF72 family)